MTERLYIGSDLNFDEVVGTAAAWLRLGGTLVILELNPARGEAYDLCMKLKTSWAELALAVLLGSLVICRSDNSAVREVCRID